MEERTDIGTLYFVTKDDGSGYLGAEFFLDIKLTEVEMKVLEHYLKGIQDLFLSNVEREGEQK